MSEKIPKSKYVLDDESIDEELIDEEEIIEEPETLTYKELREKKKRLKEEKEEAKIILKGEIRKAVLKFLGRGKVMSKRDLTHLLINDGFEEYYFKINLIENKVNYEIPFIGGVLKKLRFERKIKFSLSEGAHVYFTDFDQKILKPKEPKFDFDWKTYQIPEGKNEIYMIFKIPGSNKKYYHLLSSCFPSAEFNGFNLYVDKKYEQNYSFIIKKDTLDGYFDEDKLILRTITSPKDLNKILYTIIQIGRQIVMELLKLNMRYSEILTIINQDNTMFIPVVPVFRAMEKGAFYETKYNNALREIYDFPKKFDVHQKEIYGSFSILSKELKDDKFDLSTFNDFVEKSFEFQVKAFISNAIMRDWIINPTKAMNYMKEDDELRKLINEYLQDIDTDRIIHEKIEESMEKSEFIKDITTNLLLTLLGLSIIADAAIFQWFLIGFFIVINGYYFYSRTRKAKKKVF